MVHRDGVKGAAVKIHRIQRPDTTCTPRARPTAQASYDGSTPETRHPFISAAPRSPRPEPTASRSTGCRCASALSGASEQTAPSKVVVRRRAGARQGPAGDDRGERTTDRSRPDPRSRRAARSSPSTHLGPPRRRIRHRASRASDQVPRGCRGRWTASRRSGTGSPWPPARGGFYQSRAGLSLALAPVVRTG